MHDELEDLYLKAARAAQEEWDKDTQAVEVFNTHVLKVTSMSCPAHFRELDKDDRTHATKSMLSHLMVAMYAVKLLPPAEDDLKAMAEAINVNVANDMVLCSALICRGACDALLFFHEEDQQISADLVRSIGEALSGIYLMSELLGLDILSISPAL
jgi:hypothetical protein